MRPRRLARSPSCCSCSARRSRCRRSSGDIDDGDGRAGDRVRPERADPDRDRPAPRRGRLRPHDPPLPPASDAHRRRGRAAGEVPRRRAVLRAGDADRARPEGPRATRGRATSPSSSAAGAGARGSSACSGRADAIEAVLEGLLVERGARVRVRAVRRRPSRRWRAASTCATARPSRSTRRRRRTSTTRSPSARDGDGLRAWVHIADVSYFVPAGSPLDRGASERALSTYVPGRVAPMLPHELADDLCSLRPHQDRLCVTVEVPFAARGLERASRSSTAR